MAIEQTAENPGESLVIGEPFHYSIKSTKKRSSAPVSPVIPAHSVESVKKDLRYTFIVFAGILAVVVLLYFKMR